MSLMLRSYFRLVRLPNVFTACADIVVGSTLISANYGPESLWTLAALIGSSSALYLSGMAFNDFFDRDEDARFRPNRPIPSGEVSPMAALLCASGLLLLGGFLAAAVSLQSSLTALLLAIAILAYNTVLKKSFWLAPLCLGLCRFLNMELGLSGSSHAGASLFDFRLLEIPWVPGLALGLYAAGITAFSAQEETGARRKSIYAGWLLCLAGATCLVLGSGSPAFWIALGPLFLSLMILSVQLNREKTPAAAKALVRTGVMGICLLDGALILGLAGWAYWPQALLCVLLLLPGFILAQLLKQREA